MTVQDAARWRTLVACEDVLEALDAAREAGPASDAHSAPAQRSTADHVVVVDCRFSLSAPLAGAVEATGEAAWRAARVPGARYAHLDRDLSGPHRPGAGRHPWPDPATFAATVARWGIDADTRVALYDDGEGAMAARLWCLLRALGHREVAVMDGGWARWCALDLPQDTGAPADAASAVAMAAPRWQVPPLDVIGV